MQNQVYERADVRESYIPRQEMRHMLLGSIAELYDLLVNTNPDYYLDSEDISVVSGTDAYALPGAFWRALGVDRQDGDDWYQVPRFNWGERNMYQDGGQTQDIISYRVMGGNLRLRPTPGESFTVRLWYIPAPPDWADDGTDDGETFDGVAGWEEYAIADTIIKIRSKREEDAALEVAQKKALYARIKNSSYERDVGEPDRIRDREAETLGADPENLY